MAFTPFIIAVLLKGADALSTRQGRETQSEEKGLSFQQAAA
jgi:hypothetical protein